MKIKYEANVENCEGCNLYNKYLKFCTIDNIGWREWFLKFAELPDSKYIDSCQVRPCPIEVK